MLAVEDNLKCNVALSSINIQVIKFQCGMYSKQMCTFQNLSNKIKNLPNQTNKPESMKLLKHKKLSYLRRKCCPVLPPYIPIVTLALTYTDTYSQITNTNTLESDSLLCFGVKTVFTI